MSGARAPSADAARERFRTAEGVGIDGLLRHAAIQTPDRLAFVDDGGEISFGELEARANRLAATLRDLGARPGERAALLLPNGIPFVVAEIAFLRLGLVKVPLNIRFAADETFHALADCGAAVLIATAEHARRALAVGPGAPRTVVSVGGPADGAVDWRTATEGPPLPALPAIAYADDDPILIRYTGGTTGRPKGVVHTHRGYLAAVLDVARENRLSADDTALHLGHLSHGLNFMWPAWQIAGATQVLRERFDPAAVWCDFAGRGIAWVYMVPTMIHMLLEADDGRTAAPALRCFTYASAPMPVPLLRRAIARFGPIFTQVYTLSEAPVITTMLRPHEHTEDDLGCGPRLASVGREIATYALRLVDERGEDVPDGEPGEIALRGAAAMAGYWNRPEETAATVPDGWLRTGDMARRDRGGYLHLVDRKKDIVITGGFNVWPKEVEDALLAHPAVAQAGVVGAPDEKWGEIVVAYVVPRAGATADAAELSAFCGERLAGYKKPRRIHVVEALPLTPVGKISRAALRVWARDGSPG